MASSRSSGRNFRYRQSSTDFFHGRNWAATKNAVRTATEVLRQEAGPNLRVTEISPGAIATNFSSSMTDQAPREAVEKRFGHIAISPDAIARGILFASSCFFGAGTGTCTLAREPHCSMVVSVRFSFANDGSSYLELSGITPVNEAVAAGQVRVES